MIQDYYLEDLYLLRVNINHLNQLLIKQLILQTHHGLKVKMKFN